MELAMLKKSLYFLFVFFFFVISGNAQSKKISRPDIMYDEKSKFLSYAGDMNEEIYSLLTAEEICLYDSCLLKLGLNRDNVKWYTSELLDRLMSKNYKYSIKSVSLKTDPSLSWEKTWPGPDKLETPECLFVVTRLPNKIDEIAIHMYF
jgi:hypothetical protein